MRIVLDTNCLVQSIPKQSPYRAIWDSILTGENILCISNEILEEYAEILYRLAGAVTAEFILNALTKSAFIEYVSPYYHWNLITADPDDNKFVDCAIQANARYIVTNDHHYAILRDIKYPKIDVIALKDFADIIRGHH